MYLVDSRGNRTNVPTLEEGLMALEDFYVSPGSDLHWLRFVVLGNETVMEFYPSSKWKVIPPTPGV